MTSDSQPFSLFEGEIVIAEGFPDNNSSKFNVNRIWKPMITPPPANHSLEFLQKCSLNTQNKDM